ncbi:hypothetical protein Metho_0970 [Methanomethylovorans hollandica DSM 15978]|uniref:Uncharacterized protein n=1 Tax=Methanomethylovorans hollandica (strain DSM 15978 / NBRC 107637 / DMS1) TaxID=867904 RepID=L0KYX9_METHD|nr:hypothetical protein [Methanomethylovorans hollandica]AGB49209.1 hypothetical protein Metho_0970 [Methanomethylovorans hollandica DSM 15978]
MFESQIPGFSPFTIIVEKAVEAVFVPSVTADNEPAPVQTRQQIENVDKERIQTERSNI